MRSKEEAHDYRYFPEPDLAPLRISDEWRERLLAEMPELPASKRARFVESLGLREYDAEVLTATRPLSEYFEQVAATSQDPRAAANWVMGELMGALNAAGKEISEAPVRAGDLGELILLIAKGEVSGKMAKEIFAGMFTGGEPARAVMERQGFKQISDTAALEAIVAEVLAANPKQVEQYKSGKGAVLGFLVGQVMKATRGQANPAVVNEILQRRLR
jgi:aspartyl-tRNA(Asn)/glutamyl-tRNA(Gln) amidotransferase subunit B